MHIKPETTVGFFILFTLGLFLYMTFHIGVFRYDKVRYAPYTVFLKDASGLTKKGDIKMAGVKVGWVDSVQLNKDGTQAQAKLMILKDCCLTDNTRVAVRQDGLLGGKFVELVQGDMSGSRIHYGATLSSQDRQAVPIDDLLYTVSKVAKNLEQVTGTLKKSVSSENTQLFDFVNLVSEKISTIATSLERLSVDSLPRVINNANTTSEEMRNLVIDLKEKIPALYSSLDNITKKLQDDILPLLHKEIKEVSRQLNSDILPSVSTSAKKVASSLEIGADYIEKVAQDVQKISQKITGGQGLLSKLINEDCGYNDLRNTAKNIYYSFNRLRNISFGFDGDTEYLFNIDNKHCHNVKSNIYGYIHPCNPYFFIGGLTFSKNGYIKRQFIDCDADKIHSKESDFKELTKIKENGVSFNIQGGIYFKNNWAFRAGLFESRPGVAIDYFLPFERFRWVSSLEAYDFTGSLHHVKDHRPYLRWINRLFVVPYIYLAFGADDFASKCNKSVFLGAGIQYAS